MDSLFQILDDKTVKNVQIDLQTTEIWTKKLNILCVTAWVYDIYGTTEKLSS